MMYPQWALDQYRSFSDADIQHQRYISGFVARQGSVAGMNEIMLCNMILTERGK